MSGSPDSHPWRRHRRPVQIALIYAGLAAAWIVFSDRLLRWLVSDPDTLSRMQTFKGLFFVIVTAILLLALCMRSQKELENEVDERLRSEEALRESEAKYQSFFETFGDPMLILEGDRLVDCNSATMTLLGYDTKEEVLSKRPWEISPERQPDGSRSEEKARETIALAFAQGHHRFEWLHQRKDGQVFSVEVSLTAQPSRAGGTLLAVWRDISERRLAEEALRDSERKLHAIFDHHYQLTGLLSPEGRLLAANRTALRFAGVERPEVIGQFFWDTPWWDRSQRPELKDAFRRAARGEFVRFETTHPAADGSIRHIDFSLSPVRDDDGTVVYVVPEGRDITDIRRAEEERAELKEQLSQAEMMASMGSLVAAVAHEVRNPLFGISATLDTLEARYKGHDDIGRYAVPLREQVDRLSQLMRDLLQYGSPYEPDLQLSPVAPVIRQASGACSFLARERGVELRAVGDEELPHLRMDASRLTQAFQNVIQNAIQHSPAGAAVHLEAGLRATGQERELCCQVSDSGPGFSAGDIEHVFEPFFTQRRGGTGLGLALAWKIVREHGGRIVAENAPGGGAVVTITLPVPSSAG